MSFELKTLGGKQVLFVMAVDAEYGPHLKSRIKPLMTGVGPVEAAIVLSHALTKLQASGTMPDLLVSLGSAGSRNLEQTEVYQVSSVAYRDMDASPLGFEKGRTPFLDHPAIMPLSLIIPDVPRASLSTGGNIVSGAAYDLISADMVDMETFAVMRCCQLFGLPLIGLRGISDGKEELKHVGSWTEYLHVIDEKLAITIDALEKALESGVLAL
ncbi:5'-methylthioadenosine/S-adenosylhomocysteine nucleosidase [Neorhizobium alkalisoli]|jgi:adenosylhomocysteine nucleosidase|uniref:Adenosylhomocysteine nucleosidase n=1 Tax=Neorhizobium alkalisoli TaxID=528178 RepID=A0A561QRH3_9HYPH|nr:5'-methylthioadenosine/S-adenosylhomocysteine nucleosidase [Neorhizobium alkalisoli]TWF53001.1 adenosylhomocysteine nucleosidase [Neorhizobium alkalisoli]